MVLVVFMTAPKMFPGWAVPLKAVDFPLCNSLLCLCFCTSLPMCAFLSHRLPLYVCLIEVLTLFLFLSYLLSFSNFSIYLVMKAKHNMHFKCIPLFSLYNL